jgi:site-specific DNA recombinase
MLRRERYRGILVWNRQKKTYRGGTKVRIARHASEWIKADAPELKIVEDELWFRAQAKTERVTNSQGKKARGRPNRRLLSGFARCGQWGGPLTVTNGKSSHESIKVYSCAYNRDRGKSVRTNTLRRPVDAVNQAVADWIWDNALSEDLVFEVIATVGERLSVRANVTSSEIPKLEKDADRQDNEPRWKHA